MLATLYPIAYRWDMSNPEDELYRAAIPQNLVSRGTDERVPLREATTFDAMPQLIGSTFLTNERLNVRTHFHGEHVGVPFLVIEKVYRELADHELAVGNLEPAIDAYRRGMHYALKWLGGVSLLAGSSSTLLTGQDLRNLDIPERFGSFEERLMAVIWEGEVSFQPDHYRDFVRDVRRFEKRRLQLNQLFFQGRSYAYGETEEVDRPRDSRVGREYITICMAMKKFKEAAWIAQEMGLEDEASELAGHGDDPADSPMLIRLFAREGY